MNISDIRRLADDRPKAEQILKQVFGHEHFYDEQWKAIRRVLLGQRILMIERTGFGKSLCYQFPAVLFEGVTVVFSPLIALMRDQVKSLCQLGINAQYINCEQLPEENTKAISEAMSGKIKVLYIAPERQENQEWRTAMRSHHIKLSMVVIDEAHTISVWGHDFRPAFRRIVDLVHLLPMDMPVLATTATATERVQKDIERQIGNGFETIRGNLVRRNFRLHVIETHSEEEKMIWLAKFINYLPGTGLIYTGTRVDTDNYARWLQYLGINATSYNAGLDPASRQDIERGLMENRWHCIVSTNALGMGIDKPDIRFIIHTQIPASPIHYYQEIGRAGRDGLPTYVVLFYNSRLSDDGIPEDCRLPKAFIDGAKPEIKTYNAVIELLKNEILGEREITRRLNLKQTQVRVIKADLIEQGIIREVILNRHKKYEYQYGAPELNPAPFNQLRESKLKDLDAMVAYVYTKEPRMKFLCDFLGDKTTESFSGCDNTTEPRWISCNDDSYMQRLNAFRETYFPEIKVAERNNNIQNGVAASYYGVSVVGNAIHRSKYENGGDFPDFLLRLTMKAYRKTFGNKHLDLVMFVPPTISGTLVENFAHKIATILHVEFSKAISKTRTTEAQKIFHNAYSKHDNVKDAFSIGNINLSGKTILLVDDIYDSGATLKEIGRLLTQHGAKEIIPLVIAKTVGNDNI